jgi:hypothetical protein
MEFYGLSLGIIIEFVAASILNRSNYILYKNNNVGAFCSSVRDKQKSLQPTIK